MFSEHRILPPSPHRLTRQLPPRPRTSKPNNLVQIRSSSRLRVPIPSIGKRIGIDDLDPTITSSDEVEGGTATYCTSSSDDEDAVHTEEKDQLSWV